LNASASPLRSERGPLLCAPLPHSLRIDGLTGTNDAIDCVTLKQLRAGILERCFPGRLTTPHVALIDCTMQHPFRHFFSRSPRTIHGSMPIHGGWHSDRWHLKRKTPPLYATRGEAPPSSPQFVVPGDREDNASSRSMFRAERDTQRIAAAQHSSSAQRGGHRPQS
jgi:hypothetical protein